MDETQYMRDRLQDQIDWYDRKAGWNQRWFKRLQMLQIASAAVIPFLAGYMGMVPVDNLLPVQVAVGLLGVLSTLIGGTVALYAFQENWTNYRATAEALIQEKFLFLTGASPYDNEQAFHLLVTRAENLMSSEHVRWQTVREESAEQLEAVIAPAPEAESKAE